MKELASPDRHEEIEKLLSREVMKQEARTEELGKLQEGKLDLGECLIKIRKSAHPGVHVQIGPGELVIEEEYRSATFHYDQESGEVVGMLGSGGRK